MSPRLSVIVITLNEETDLPACLESVKALDAEIVVVDNHSSDRTREIAENAGAKFVIRDFEGYAPQKQSALDLATGDWVLSIDADERLTPELRDEIAALSESANGSGPSGYEIPFRVHFMGRRLRFGGLGGERHLRLFRRASGRFVGGGSTRESSLRESPAACAGPSSTIPIAISTSISIRCGSTPARPPPSVGSRGGASARSIICCPSGSFFSAPSCDWAFSTERPGLFGPAFLPSTPG